MEALQSEIELILNRSRREQEGIMINTKKVAEEIRDYLKERYNNGKPVTENKNDKISY